MKTVTFSICTLGRAGLALCAADSASLSAKPGNVTTNVPTLNNFLGSSSGGGLIAGDALIDYIGGDDGSGIGGNISASQYFNADFAAYDIASAQPFTLDADASLSSVEAVVNGWNGYVGPDGITGYEVNVYSSSAALCANLTGDVYGQDVAGNISGTWTGAGSLVQFDASTSLAGGEYYLSVIPRNDFTSNGQTGIADSGTAADVGTQSNPNGGFGFGCQDMAAAVAYRMMGSGGAGDPCDQPLTGLCPADVNGDGLVNVGDLLAILDNWGAVGDGTFRPTGDCRPLPNGDCAVNVSDLLGVIDEWGSVCVAQGACCYADGSCNEDTSEAACADAGGNYLGDDSDCSGCVTGACCTSETDCTNMTGAACSDAGGSYKGDGTDCASIECVVSCDGGVGCQNPDQSGHGADGIIGATSDLNPGYSVADTLMASTDGAITQVCWWGMYIDFGASAPCDPVNPDDFTITFYADDAGGSEPGTDMGTYAVTVARDLTGNVIPSGIGDIPEYQFVASIDGGMDVMAGTCYWIAIVNNTLDECYYLWETAPAGDSRSSQLQGGAWVENDFDLAFCVDVETNADGCGVFTGACCLGADNCLEGQTAAECGEAGGEWSGNGVTCADVNNCNQIPGACCIDEFTCLDDFTDSDCVDFGGTFQGDGTICDDLPGGECFFPEPAPYDQIGPDDGSQVTGNITASQYFEEAYTAYDIATLDDFDLTAAETMTSMEFVLNGWNGYVGPDSIESYEVNVYSVDTAACTDLQGDLHTVAVPAADVSYSDTWAGAGVVVVIPTGDMAMDAGVKWFSVIPRNDFATGGQTGIAGSNLGDIAAWQANPNGGFGFGGCQAVAGSAAIRVNVVDP